MVKMSKHIGRMASSVAGCLLMLAAGSDSASAAQTISLVNISQLPVTSASAFHRIAVSRVDPNLVAVAWREYGLPINTNAGAGPGERTADCHVSVSTDGGMTFHDTNLMPMLRQNNGDPELPTEPAPGLYYCNAPWVAIGDDGTIYGGGSVFTPLGDRNWYPARGTDAPKQGRALVTVSTDYGQSWSAPTFGIRVSNFAPGTGLGCSNNLPCVSTPAGTDQWHTPWDGAIGVFAPGSPTFYSKAGSLVVASEDHAQTFGFANAIRVPGWTFSSGKMDASHDVLVMPIIASVTPLGATCPCLGVATSTDKGATWTAQLIAEADEFNSSGAGDTAHYPFAAADPTAPWKYAVSVYTPDRKSMQVFWTDDDGDTWNNAAVGPLPVAGTVARAGKMGVGYTSDGRILAVWRAFFEPDFQNVPGGPGWFDTFAALLENGSFGPTVRVSPESSKYPTRTTVGADVPNAANYNLNNGGGDFSTFITGNKQFALVGFPYAPGDPDTSALDTYFAKVPLALMQFPHMLLRAVPSVLNLRTAAGLVTAVLTADTGDLSTWNVSNIRLQGIAPVSIAKSGDGQTLVATFSKNSLMILPAGNAVAVSITGDLERDGITTPFATSTTVRVMK
jgi:hypothetical protein